MLRQEYDASFVIEIHTGIEFHDIFRSHWDPVERKTVSQCGRL